MALPEFPLRFENPLFGIFGLFLVGVFVVLFYFSRKRLRLAEKTLELVRWRIVRRAINVTNISMKICMIATLSFLLATPYMPINVKIPINELSEEQLAQTGVSIMMLMDVSYSMNYSDLTPNRLEVAKQMARLFLINISIVDIVGFISFAGQIYNNILPTTNRSAVINVIDNQTIRPSTAIGTALETALGVLEQYEGGKAIVLFSDGKNNVGILNLTSVVEDAAALKIPIYTVFVGTYGVLESDPVVLQDMSALTGGKFFEVKSEDIKTLTAEVSMISQEVKVGALKAASDTISFESRDFHTPMQFFAILLVLSLFLTWVTGV